MAIKRTFSSKEGKELLKNYNNALKIANLFYGKQHKNEKRIKYLIKELKKREAVEELKAISLDQINYKELGHFRPNIKLLSEHRIKTVYDVYTRSDSDITSISGIGKKSLYVLKDVTQMIFAAKYKTARINLNAKKKNGELTDFVINLKRYQEFQKIENSAEKLYDFLVERRKSIRKIKRSRGIFWIFRNQASKQEINDLYEKLSDDFKNIIEPYFTTVKKTIFQCDDLSARDIWIDFKVNSASYYSLLDRLDSQQTDDVDTEFYLKQSANRDEKDRTNGKYEVAQKKERDKPEIDLFDFSDEYTDEDYKEFTEYRKSLPKFLFEEILDQEINISGLRCTLRRYQELGVKYAIHQKRALLGDEMGLGKTVQAIGAITSFHNQGLKYFMVVCPLAVLNNWCNELRKFSDIAYYKIHHDYSPINKWKEEGGVIVTTYETLQKLYMFIDDGCDFLVVDEAHFIKNITSKRSIVSRKLIDKSKNVLLMTGTPLENKKDEMCSLIEYVNPQAAKIAKSCASFGTPKEFRDSVATVYYRRRCKDVLKEMPEKTESAEWCELNDYEHEKYEESLLLNKQAARQVSWNVDDIKHSSKAIRLKEICDEAKNSGRKVLIFSFYKNTLEVVKNLLGEEALGPINGATNINQRQEILDKFGSSQEYPFLIMQVNVGGVGINLQCASVVVFCEPQVKPSTEVQAIARAYRMGQINKVLVYRLLTVGTIEESFINMLSMKQKTFDSYADKSTVNELDKDAENELEKEFTNIYEEAKNALLKRKNNSSTNEKTSNNKQKVYYCSDLHFDEKINQKFETKALANEKVRNYIDSAVEQVTEYISKEDILFVLGDVCDDLLLFERFTKRLLSRHSNTFIILGNHEISFGFDKYSDYVSTLKKQHFLLENEVVGVSINNDSKIYISEEELLDESSSFIKQSLSKCDLIIFGSSFYRESRMIATDIVVRLKEIIDNKKVIIATHERFNATNNIKMGGNWYNLYGHDHKIMRIDGDGLFGDGQRPNGDDYLPASIEIKCDV